MQETFRIRYQKLKDQVRQAYLDHNSDLFLIPNDMRQLFLLPLEDRLSQDIDSLQCFQATYTVALQALQITKQKQAANFFFLSEESPYAYPCRQERTHGGALFRRPYSF